MLRATGDLSLDSLSHQFLLQGGLEFLEEANAFVASFLQRTGNFEVSVGLYITKSQVFQFPFELPDAQAVCQRRIDFARFERQGITKLARGVLRFP